MFLTCETQEIEFLFSALVISLQRLSFACWDQKHQIMFAFLLFIESMFTYFLWLCLLLVLCYVVWLLYLKHGFVLFISKLSQSFRSKIFPFLNQHYCSSSHFAFFVSFIETSLLSLQISCASMLYMLQHNCSTVLWSHFRHVCSGMNGQFYKMNVCRNIITCTCTTGKL